MALQKTFNILAHFKFEVGAATANIGKINTGLEKMTNNLKGVEGQFKALFAHSALSFTGGAAGIAGTIQKMTTASEEYYQFQRKLSTIMVANTKKQMDFNVAMRTSATIIKDLARDAQKFALPIDDYSSVFSELAGPMAAKGVAGDNFSKTRSLARNFMMMSRVFPVEPWQLQNLMAGAITNQNPLFRILKDDTEAFKGMSLGRWRGMKYGQKVDKLNQAFDQYSMSNPQIMESYISSLGGQFEILNNYFKSLTSILKPLGDVIRGPVIKGLTEINEWIGTKLAKAVKTLAGVLKPLTSDLERLYIEFDKLKRLGGTLQASKMASAMAFMFVEFRRFLPFIAKWATKLGILGGSGAVAMGAGFVSMLKWITKSKTGLKAFGKVLAFFAKSLGTYLAFFVPLTALFRVIDSAKAQAKIADMKKYSAELPIITEKTAEVARGLAAIQFPLSSLINMLGESISVLFQKTFWLEKIYKLLIKFDVETKIRNILGGIVVIFSLLTASVVNFGKLVWTVLKNPAAIFDMQTYKKAWAAYLKDAMDFTEHMVGKFNKHFDKFLEEAEKPPAPLYVNNGPITIRNQFPENMEPDRIAVAMKDAFLKSEQARVDTDRRTQIFSPAASAGAVGP